MQDITGLSPEELTAMGFDKVCFIGGNSSVEYSPADAAYHVELSTAIGIPLEAECVSIQHANDLHPMTTPHELPTPPESPFRG
jgi:hypothetical protein